VIDIEKIRSDFPILARTVHGKPLVYLDNAATTQKPQPVLDQILRFYTDCNSNIHRGVHHLSGAASRDFEAARETVGGFINAQRAAEIIFTPGTTAGINLVAQSFGHAFLNPGDEIIITEMEHHSNWVPWHMACERAGAHLKVLPFNDDGMLLTDNLPALITGKTKLIALSYVSNAIGVVNPVRQVVEMAHARNVPVLIDGAQAVQHLPVDVQALDCDFFVFSGHKMYAETGIGVLYGKENWLASMPTYQCGGGMMDAVAPGKILFADPPLKFEAGTPNISGVLSLKAAIGYITEIGLANIAAYEQGLLHYTVEKLEGLEGVVCYAKASEKCNAVSFNVDGLSSYDVGLMLDKMGIAIRSGKHCAEPVMKHYGINGTVRASLALYNTDAEIDRMIEALERILTLMR